MLALPALPYSRATPPEPEPAALSEYEPAPITVEPLMPAWLISPYTSLNYFYVWHPSRIDNPGNF